MKPRMVGAKSIAAPAPTNRMIGVMLSASADSENLSRRRRMPSGVERIVTSWTTVNISVSRIRSGGMPKRSLHTHRMTTLSAAPTSALHRSSTAESRSNRASRGVSPCWIGSTPYWTMICQVWKPTKVASACAAPLISANRPKSTTPKVRVAKPR
jgi:hypothetical protein